jgi:hypothetical protein
LTTLAAGTQLGRYEIREIGAGGMSEVYRAYGGAMHREVAIGRSGLIRLLGA